jgi:DNA-binding Lrp family transcriptional regulator
MKDVELRLISELMKNGRRSDRELAKTIGVSQPTASRVRSRLEKEGIIKEYTMIPDFRKLGFEIVAFTFVRHNIKYAKPEVKEEAFRKVEEWMMKQPNVIFASEGQGMGWDGIFVSLHRNYSGFIEFMNKHDTELPEFLVDSQSFISNISPTTIRKPFHLKYLEKAK